MVYCSFIAHNHHSAKLPARLSKALYLKMTYATEFEKETIRKSCKRHVSSDLLDEILKAEASDYEYSGCGYFLYFKHEGLPSQRVVCDEPKIMGEWNKIQSGFLVFLGENELMLECHNWGDIDVPSNYRENEVVVFEINI